MSETGDQGNTGIGDVIAAVGTAISAMGSTQPTQQYPMPPRVVVRGSRGTGVYTGQNLVDENNRLTNLTAYDVSEDYAKFLYGQMSPAARQKAFTILKQKGFYGGRDVGFYANDVNAIQLWLDYANTLGVTSQRALLEMQKNLPDYGGGGGGGYRPRFRVSAADDLKVVAKQVAQQTLGRAFTEDEANRFVQAYQQREVEFQQQMMAGGVVQEAPSPDVAAQQFAQQVAPTEANGYKFLGYMNKVFNAIGGQ